MFNKNFVAIQEIKPVLKFDKPIYEGFSVLDLSKLLMYKFHYKYTEKKLLLVYYLQTQIVQFMKVKQIMFMKIFMRIKTFDFSDYL